MCFAKKTVRHNFAAWPDGGCPSNGQGSNKRPPTVWRYKSEPANGLPLGYVICTDGPVDGAFSGMEPPYAICFVSEFLETRMPPLKTADKLNFKLTGMFDVDCLQIHLLFLDNMLSVRIDHRIDYLKFL